MAGHWGTRSVIVRRGADVALTRGEGDRPIVDRRLYWANAEGGVGPAVRFCVSPPI